MHRLYGRDDRFAVVDHAARNGDILSERRRQGAREDHQQGYDVRMADGPRSTLNVDRYMRISLN